MKILCGRRLRLIRLDFMVDNRPITTNAIVPIRASAAKARSVVQIVLLEFRASAQVLEEAFRSTDFTLDHCTDSEVCALV